MTEQDSGMQEQEKAENEEQSGEIGQSGDTGTQGKPELFSKEFFHQFTEREDHVTFRLLNKCGLFIKDDGTYKYRLATMKPLLEEMLTLYYEDIMDLDQVRDMLERFINKKLTRYAMDVELTRLRRNAGKG